MSDPADSLREQPVSPGDGAIPVQVNGADSTAERAVDARRGQMLVPLWLKRADQLLLGFLLIALLVLLTAFRWKLSGGGHGEIEIVSQQPREFFYSIDINKASWVEWAQLDGVGEKLGRRIVKDREDHGPFASIDDLRRVRGVGPKFIEKARPFLRYKAGEQSSVDDPTATVKGLR